MPTNVRDLLRRHACALLLVAAALAAHRLIAVFLGEGHPFFPFFIALVLAAAYGGYGPALLALLLSWMLIDALALAPPANPQVLRTRSQIAFAFFSVGLGVTVLGGSLRAARRRGLDDREALRRAYEAQRAEREWLEITLASIADAVITTDPDGLVTSLNRVACRLTGWDPGEAVGRPLREVFRTVREVSRRTDDLPIARIVGDGEVIVSDDELELIDRGGVARAVQHHAAPIRDARGKVKGAVIVFRDVSERQQAERARRESEDRFHQLADHIHDVFWIYELEEGKIGYISPAYESVWGRSRRSLHERPLSYLEAVHPDDRDHAWRAHQTLVKGQVTADEYRIIRPDGSVRWVWDRGFPIRDEAGRLVRIAGIAEDITARKRVEEALRESEERFRTLADSMPALIWGVGTDRRCNYFNKPWLDFTGRSVAQEMGDGWADGVHPDDRSRCLGIFHAAFAARAQFTMEYRLRRHDGEYRWLLDTGVPRFTPDGTFSGYIGSCLDITDRKRAEEELRDSDRRKEEFLAVLSHELRNPLAPIQSALELLEGQAGAGGDRELAMIRRQVNNLRRLVDDLLDISRISRGKIELHREPVDLTVLVAQSVEAVRPMFSEHGLDLQVAIAEAPCVMEADPTRLEQVLFNLLVNAAKYTPDGGRVWLEVARAEAGGEAIIRVRDTGIGIEPELLPRIFDLFLQGERRGGLSHEGGGIGLSLARDLIALHGGTITAGSPGPDRGSEFVVRLPLAVTARRPAPPPCPAPPASAPPRPAPRWRVLVVDDNVPAADSLGILLSTVLGLEVRVAYSGGRALELAAAFRPELVLLDLEMAGMDGYEVARRLRESAAEPRPAIVAVTGWGHEEDRRRSLSMGLDRHLVKPVTLGDLREVVERLRPGPGPRVSAAGGPSLVPAG